MIEHVRNGDISFDNLPSNCSRQSEERIETREVVRFDAVVNSMGHSLEDASEQQYWEKSNFAESSIQMNVELEREIQRPY